MGTMAAWFDTGKYVAATIRRATISGPPPPRKRQSTSSPEASATNPTGMPAGPGSGSSSGTPSLDGIADRAT